jgi:hypothetical protein
MVVIDSQGWLYGKRIGRCSDAAQLHFGRLLNSSDGFGRIPLNTQYLHSTVYASFREKPGEVELLGYFEEYKVHDLAFIYEVNGQIWCQWDVQEKYLPRYKSAKDKQSPAPDNQQLTEWKAGIRRKTLKTSEIFGKLLKVPNSSEDSGTFPLVIGVGVGVGEVETHISSPLPADDISASSNRSGGKRNRKSQSPDPPPAELSQMAAWFHRRDTTPFSAGELKAFRNLGEIHADDMAVLAQYYRAELPAEKNYRRRDLQTLLNNFLGEVDRARAWISDSTPSRPGIAAPADHLGGFVKGFDQ